MPQTSLLKKLGHYKEFLAIVAAAIGGFVWFENLVAKQADLVAVKNSLGSLATVSAIEELECQLDLYMTLTQYQMQILANSEQMSDTRAETEIVKVALENAENLYTIQTLNNRLNLVNAKLEKFSEKQDTLNGQIAATALRISTNYCG